MEMLPKIILGLVALTCAAAMALWLTWRDGYDVGQDEMLARWNSERIEQSRAKAAALLKLRQQELVLQSTIDRLKREHHETLQRLAAERDDLVHQLRRRPERPSGYLPAAAQAASPVAATTCSADQLYREDATALVGLAADADQVRAALTECRNAYDAASQPTP